MIQQIVRKDAVIDRLSQASQILVEAKSMQEVKKIMDVADAARIYAKRQQLGDEAVGYANSIKIEAMRRLGKLWKDAPKNKGTQATSQLGGYQENPPSSLADLGISKKQAHTIRRLEEMPDKEFEQVKEGVMGMAEALRQVKIEKRKSELQKQKSEIDNCVVKMPEGVFEVVVMDPPWNYGREYDPEGSRIANPYPEMPQADLLKLSPPFADNCVLFLWTTHAFIWDAKQLIDAWGFDYKATLIWDKEKMGMGAWLRMQCEFCLVAIKGKPAWSNTTWRDIIKEPRRQHSRKPDTFYKLVEEVTVGRRLDFFSREQRSGWASFGNDEHKFSN
jgi:N6-adenosine-specific RNA methylase IME4